MEDEFLVSSAALEMMRRMNYMLGMGLGRNQQGIAEFPSFPKNNHHFGLEYVPKKSDPKKRWRNRAQAHAAKKKSVVNFVSEGEKALYQGQPEPFLDMETKEKYLRFEIFAADTWDSDDEAKKREELVKVL